MNTANHTKCSTPRKTPVLTRLNQSEFDELNKIVARTGLSRSDVLRIAIRHWSNTARANGFELPAVAERTGE